MVVTCQQMQEAEAKLFATGVEAEPLMEKAGAGCARAVIQAFPKPGRAILYCGKGNNGGDALVVGRILRQRGWDVSVRFSHPVETVSELAQKKYREFSEVENGRNDREHLVLIDGLLGIGAKGAIRGELRKLADELNTTRRKEWAACFAVDIPSGLDGDSGEVYEGAVMADHTLSICAPKLGILQDSAINHVGRIHEIPLPEIPVADVCDHTLRLLSPENLRSRLLRRSFDTHKGKAGRVAIVAGSEGLTGAAVLTSLGALHAGAGLITTFVPRTIYSIVASQAPVEVMVRPYKLFSEIESIAENADVFAIGPGLGSVAGQDLLQFIKDDPRPAVVDADALNWLADEPECLKQLPAGKRVLTPHPGELARLAGGRSFDTRLDATRTLAREWNVTLLHKGARTIVSTEGHPSEFNSTGTSQMASGGMGDVLTGITAGLIGQGISLHDSACLGSWLLGRAAELAKPEVTASRVAKRVGRAIADLGGNL